MHDESYADNGRHHIHCKSSHRAARLPQGIQNVCHAMSPLPAHPYVLLHTELTGTTAGKMYAHALGQDGARESERPPLGSS